MTAVYKKIFYRNVFTVLLVPVVLFLLSIWAGREAAEVEGPLRLVKGPHDTIYVQIDRNIAKASSNGELLSVLDLGTDASVPVAADFFVEEDGRLLFARPNSQLLQYYSPEGKPLTTNVRLPSRCSGEKDSCSLTKDRSTGILYFADAFRHRILIFAPHEKEAKTITVPPDSQAPSIPAGMADIPDPARSLSWETPIRYPHGLTFAGDRLIAADTGNSRLVLFYPDGALDKIIPVFPLDSPSFINPVKVDRFSDTIYVVVRGPGFIGGEVQSYEFNTGLPRKFRYSGAGDPRDVLARRDDVLVADRASLTVMRYAHSGLFLGTFGKRGLQSLYTASQLRRKTYGWIRKGSLAGMAGVIAWILFFADNRLAVLRNVLGPPRSARRRILLLVPGVAHAAAGRPLRAGILQLILVYFVCAFIYSSIRYWSPSAPALALPVLLTTGLMAYSVWISIVLDGMRLSGRPGDSEDALFAKGRCRAAAAALLITVGSGTAAQLIREFIVHSYPEAPPAIRQLVYLLVTSVYGRSSLAAALFGTFAWQEKAHRSEIATAIVAGFLAGVYTWLFTAVVTGNSLDWMLYAPLIQGLLLGSFTYLYFRRKGMPSLIIPVAVAGAWIGYSLKFIFRVFAGPIANMLSQGDAGGLWTGAIARLELILVPAFFIHLAVAVTWNIASERTAAHADCVIRKEEGLFVSS